MLGEPPAQVDPLYSGSASPQSFSSSCMMGKVAGNQILDFQILEIISEIVILQGSLTQSFHRLDLLESCKQQLCSWQWPCKLLVAAREQTGGSNLAPPESFGSS